MFASVAHAAGTAPAAGAAGAGGFAGMIPFILIFVVFYFLLIRPQQKQAKRQQQFLASLKRGIRVTTTGGILGTITDLSEKLVTLEIADGVKIEITRASIAGQVDKKGEPVGEKKEEKKKIK